MATGFSSTTAKASRRVMPTTVSSSLILVRWL
jgi:hypothetical protein